MKTKPVYGAVYVKVQQFTNVINVMCTSIQTIFIKPNKSP